MQVEFELLDNQEKGRTNKKDICCIFEQIFQVIIYQLYGI